MNHYRRLSRIEKTIILRNLILRADDAEEYELSRKELWSSPTVLQRGNVLDRDLISKEGGFSRASSYIQYIIA